MHVVDNVLQSLTTSVFSKELRVNSEIYIKKADKDTTTVIMNKQDKIQEGFILLDDRNNYVPLETPMVKDMFQTVPFPIHFILSLSPILGLGLLINNGETINHTLCARNWKAKRNNLFKICGP